MNISEEEISTSFIKDYESVFVPTEIEKINAEVVELKDKKVSYFTKFWKNK